MTSMIFYKETLRPCIISAIENIRFSNNENRKKYFLDYLQKLLFVRKNILRIRKQQLPPEYFEETKNLKPNQQIELF